MLNIQLNSDTSDFGKSDEKTNAFRNASKSWIFFRLLNLIFTLCVILMSEKSLSFVWALISEHWALNSEHFSSHCNGAQCSMLNAYIGKLGCQCTIISTRNFYLGMGNHFFYSFLHILLKPKTRKYCRRTRLWALFLTFNIGCGQKCTFGWDGSKVNICFENFPFFLIF